jgi:3-phosphoshikimate 1-carboxyvinyltransferase
LPAPLTGGSVDSGGDHRLAMLGAVAGLASQGGVSVIGFEAAAVSFPTFQQSLVEVLRQ